MASHQRGFASRCWSRCGVFTATEGNERAIRETEGWLCESRLDIKVPNATDVVTGLKPVIDTWTLSADGRTLTHDADDHKEIYVYEKQ